MAEGDVWHVLVRIGEHVSILKNLSSDCARAAAQRLGPWSNPWSHERLWATAAAMADGGGGVTLTTYSRPGSDVQLVECFGPPGETLEIWPKPDDWDARLEEAVLMSRKAKAINDDIERRFDDGHRQGH